MIKTVFDEDDLIGVLEPMKPYLPEIVVCGGWTLYIYRKWVLGQPGPLPLRTGDVDVAVPKRLPVQAEPLEKLLGEAGFHEDLTGSGRLPVMHFIRKGSPFIEFLTPRRSSKDPDVVSIQEGVTAQVLQYLDIILDHSRSVQVPRRDFEVRIPTAAAYLYQKGLSFPHRAKRDHKAKDLAYLFEILNNFPEFRKALPGELIELSRRCPGNWLRSFRKNLEKEFPSIDGDGVADVVGQKPHPFTEMIRSDPTGGRMLFAQTVFNGFKSFLKELG